MSKVSLLIYKSHEENFSSIRHILLASKNLKQLESLASRLNKVLSRSEKVFIETPYNISILNDQVKISRESYGSSFGFYEVDNLKDFKEKKGFFKDKSNFIYLDVLNSYSNFDLKNISLDLFGSKDALEFECKNINKN